MKEYKDFHFFVGSGGAALGFGKGHARIGQLEARFRSLGGIDSDPAAIRDFEALTGSRGTVLDLFTEAQHRAFHGKPPPAGWREATYHDIREAAGFENPDAVFLSPPCKGFSALLNKKAANSAKYQALNELVARSIRLMMDAWGDDPPALILIENVPRIQQRGRALLDEVIGLLDAAGYSVAETTHDCGELGGLAQHRRRFLLVARLRSKVKSFLYEPPVQRVRAVGEVLADLPLPDDEASGPMHRSPRLRWETWVRLALIPAGKDWRALRDIPWQRYSIAPQASSGAFNVADPSVSMGQHHGKLRVEPYGEPAHTITGSDRVGSGALSVADPRLREGRFNNVYRLVRWDEASPAVTGGNSPSGGALSVADPRPPRDLGSYRPYGILPFDQPAGTVTGMASPGAGVFSVADPRVLDSKRTHTGQGHYGVVPFDQPARTVTGAGTHDNGWGSVADPRLPEAGSCPDPVPVIVALDGTWHRPFTTMELAALQGFPVEGGLVLDGSSHSAWRGRIGNAVPVPTGAAIASAMLHCLLANDVGRTFELSATPIWVHPLLIGLSMERPRV